jgi:chorismate mutase
MSRSFQEGRDEGREEHLMPCRGIRGATTVENNTREAILDATRELLSEMVLANAVDKEDVASAYFTTTPGLDAEFPAVAARNDFGWTDVALMCGHEMDVPGSLHMCLRIMLLVNTDRSQADICHVACSAAILRPDLTPAATRRISRT